MLSKWQYYYFIKMIVVSNDLHGRQAVTAGDINISWQLRRGALAKLIPRPVNSVDKGGRDFVE